MDAQINISPPSWLKIPLSSLPPVLGCEQCWSTEKKPLPSFLSLPIPVTPPSKRAVVVAYQLCVLGPHLNLPPSALLKNGSPIKTSVQFSSVAQSCPTLCDPMNQSTPGLPVHHQLPEFTQTHIHRVSDAIHPSHRLSSPSRPAPNPSQHESTLPMR